MLSGLITSVISPLKSLICDQVESLKKLGVSTCMLCGEQPEREVNQIFATLQTNPQQIKLLYTTPEKNSSNPRLRSLLKQLYENDSLGRFVIDEAHYIM